jgi:hypothetical protein
VQCFPRTIDVHLGVAGQRLDLGNVWKAVFVVIECWGKDFNWR